MTKVQIQKQKGNTTGFVVSGHSGYAEEGSDIVCSAISATAQMVCVGLENVLNLNPTIKIDGKKAYLSCKLPKQITNEQIQQAQILFSSFEKSVELLIGGDKKLKKYITLEVKNEVY